LTILVIVGTRTDEHSLSSQVGIGSESLNNFYWDSKNVVIKSRTGRHMVFKLGGKVNHVTRFVRQLFKVKRSKVNVTHKKFTQSMALALVTLESKRRLIVVRAQ